MNMTHYMELLATNQPWNLIRYMVIPVIIVEALVAIEFLIVFRRQTQGSLRTASKILSIFGGAYFAFVVFFPLLFTAIPGIKWRTVVDFIAVWSYLLGVIPLGALTLLDLGVIGKKLDDMGKMKQHFIWLTVFLIIAHVAMIFGMVNPEIVKSSGAAMGNGM